MTELMTEREAAEYLRMSPLTLRKWRCNGEQRIRYRKIGRRALYTPEDLAEYVERCAREAQTA